MALSRVSIAKASCSSNYPKQSRFTQKAIEIISGSAVKGNSEKHLPQFIQDQAQGTSFAQLRADTQSPADMLVSDFMDTRDPKLKVKALESIRKKLPVFDGEEEKLKTLIEGINAFCQKGRKLHLTLVLEFLVARDEIIEHFDAIELADSDLRLADVITSEHDRLIER